MLGFDALARLPLAAAGERISGALAATQAANSVSASGTVRVRAALAQTQADQTLSAAGVLPITGSLSAFEAENTVSATAVAVIAGTLSQTQADQTLSATAIGSAATTGSLSQTQAAQTLSAAGSVLIEGALTQTQADQTLNAAGLVVVKGALAQTQDTNTVSAAGITNTKGALAQTQADQTLSAAAITNTKGALATSVSWTFDTDVSGWSAFGTGAILTWDAANQRAQVETTAQQQGMSTTVPLPTGGDYRVDVTITNGAAVSRSYRATMGAGASGFVTIPAGATQAVSFYIVGANSSTLVIRTGGIFTPAVGEKHYFDNVSVLLAQPGNTVSAAGVLPIKGTLTQTQQNHTSSGAAGVDIEGALAATQADQTLGATGLSGRISGELAVTQADQTLAATATAPVMGSLNVTQESDRVEPPPPFVVAPSYGHWAKTKNKNKPQAPQFPKPLEAGEVVIDEAVLRQMEEERLAALVLQKKSEALSTTELLRATVPATEGRASRSITLRDNTFDKVETTPEVRRSVVTLFRPPSKPALVDPIRGSITLRALGPRRMPEPDMRRSKIISLRRSAG